ncbi:flavodoxin signature [Lucifera butyrica]|uniref:Flavodoxin signature n=1 Tax=Lucifera butyrica TaxID=1351585 RepID=A0A498QXM3_9FIRM|nr:flavodoxin [Lucifera butyrica]VBB04906.1 flavodoxin signature [Lucifera butyrica]
MKKILTLLLSALMLFSLIGCGNRTSTVSNSSPQQTASTSNDKNTSDASNAKIAEKGGKKILIVYFSHTGNTRKAANQIHELVGGNIIEIKTETPYPTNYNECTDLAKREKESNARPKLSTKVENMGSYDVIFVGYPIWWYTAPMAIHTFLETYDLSGKTVIPFCTSAGSDVAESMPAIKSLCPNSTVLQGLTANNLNDIKPWLSKLGML